MAFIPLLALLAALPLPADSPARPIEEHDDLLDFTYGWPHEAQVIPALSRSLEADMRSERAQALEWAREDRKARSANTPFNSHDYNRVWTTAGQSPRLLSLTAESYSFTGGAHGNTAFAQILWDRQAAREIEPADLFGEPAAAYRLIAAAFCPALDTERAQRREETLPLTGEGWMVTCPPLDKQVIAPADTDEDGRFDTIAILLPPYEAGPYVEGSYAVQIPVTTALIEHLKPAFRTDFEPPHAR